MMDDNKVSTAEDNGWAAILDTRAKLGRAWSEHLSEHKRQAENGRYIRIRGKAFRAISISSENPCGQLRDEAGLAIKEKRGIVAAIESANRSSTDNKYVPGNGKTEMKIQAFLIREALLNNLNFGRSFKGFEKIFDELLFITDEMRLGDDGKVKPDMIAIGRRSGVYFPVLIELKVSLKLERLEEQLNNAKHILDKDQDIQERFIKFLSAVSKIDIIDYSKMLLLIIWPGSKHGDERKSVQEARDRGIFMARYSPQDMEYSFELDDPSIGRAGIAQIQTA